MDAAEYDRDARERRSVVRLGFWLGVLLVGVFAFAYVWRLLIGPYAQFVFERQTRASESAAYIRSSTCVDPQTMAEVGSYRASCEAARRVLAQGVYGGAFNDLMEHLAWCKDGVCTLAGYNITNVLMLIACGGFALFSVAWCFGLVQFTSSYYARQVGLMQLPMTAGPPPAAWGYAQPPSPAFVKDTPSSGGATFPSVYSTSALIGHDKND